MVLAELVGRGVDIGGYALDGGGLVRGGEAGDRAAGAGKKLVVMLLLAGELAALAESPLGRPGEGHCGRLGGRSLAWLEIDR